MPVLLQGAAWPFGRFCVNFFTHLKIRGRGNLEMAHDIARKQKTGVILAVNHTHELDFLFPLVAIPPHSPLFPLFYVAKMRKSYAADSGFGLRRFIYGLPAFLTSWGAHPFVSGQRDYTKSMPYHEALLRKGKTVCIFPEGKISKDDMYDNPKIHGGVAYLSESTHAPIVPIYVHGAEKMTIFEFLLRKRKVVVSYGTPLDIKSIIDYTKEVPERYKGASQAIMSTLYHNPI